LADEQSEWFRVKRDPLGASIYRIETHVADQRSREILALSSLPHYARLGRAALRWAATGWD
jgi:hypothetical protein